MKIEQIPVFFDEKKQKFILNMACTALNDDWIRAARLQKKADAGDKVAQKELERLDLIPTFTRDNMQINSLDIYTITTDPEYTIQEKQHDGKTYWVVPVVMMREGVHKGSHGPLLHRAEDLGHFVESWNGIPVTIKHPQKDGRMVSANAPDILDSYNVGRIYGAYMDGDRLKGEAWLNPDRLKQVSDMAYQFIKTKQPLDVSVGVFTDDELETGQWNSEEYSAIAKNHRPDHLALLPGSRGACSWEDGCGIRVNEMTRTKFRKENTMPENKPCCPEKVELLIQDDDSKFTEADRDWLLTMSEEQLDKVHPVVVTKEVIKEVEKKVQINTADAIQVLKAEMSDIDKFMQLVPEKIKTQFQYGMKLHEDRRQELIESITANQSEQVWTKDDLKNMDIATLDKFAKAIRPKQNFAGRAAGGGNPNTNSAEEMLLPLGLK